MKYKLTRRETVDDSHLPNHLHPLIKQLLARRGVAGDDCEQELSRLLRPETMLGLDRAACLLADAAMASKRMLIVGDFDADGATSTSVCLLALKMLGIHGADFLIPNRFDYGYGLSVPLVALAVEKIGRAHV